MRVTPDVKILKLLSKISDLVVQVGEIAKKLDSSFQPAKAKAKVKTQKVHMLKVVKKAKK